MVPLGDNPFTVLTTVVAPAVLTNASSVLSLGTSNRIARVVDRVRVVSAEIMALPEDSEDCAYWQKQLSGLRARARYLFWALRMAYASLAAFATAALVAILGTAAAAFGAELAFQIAAAVGLLVGVLGVGGLAVGCVMMVGEVRMALNQTTDEADYALSHRPKGGCPESPTTL
ncbi:MAG: DUF2721 domain-containing protein [Bryobacterales bacterium]|nr:DUF2721 domain-containing protein [Bryobacterales bacterium]